MTDAPPLNGGDPSVVFEWLVEAVADASSVHVETDAKGDTIWLEGQPWPNAIGTWADINILRLATAIRDHVLDREKVRAALASAINGSMICGRGGVCEYGFSTDTDCSWDMDDLIDRLIESLSR